MGDQINQNSSCCGPTSFSLPNVLGNFKGKVFNLGKSTYEKNVQYRLILENGKHGSGAEVINRDSLFM